MSKKVKITESELIDLIDNIVTEAVAEKKKQWIAENQSKSANVLEERIKSLEKKLLSITESKK